MAMMPMRIDSQAEPPAVPDSSGTETKKRKKKGEGKGVQSADDSQGEPSADMRDGAAWDEGTFFVDDTDLPPGAPSSARNTIALDFAPEEPDKFGNVEGFAPYPSALVHPNTPITHNPEEH